jgi:hypothetical protein
MVDAAFDPKKFLAETGGFDPSKFLKETAPTVSPERIAGRKAVKESLTTSG